MVVNKDKLMQKEFEQKCKIETIRCAGRCDIELGDITKHNVMGSTPSKLRPDPRRLYTDKIRRPTLLPSKARGATLL
ncbi:unnamed protein product [Meloidogyne enterolobii]|uniref:Uncharacterized protein n=1 Tax=Meloidogyne enterolobii TaxID=390850 RepID=A0ACB0YGE2_MELEN